MGSELCSGCKCVCITDNTIAYLFDWRTEYILKILSIGADRSRQTVQTQVRLLLRWSRFHLIRQIRLLW